MITNFDRVLSSVKNSFLGERLPIDLVNNENKIIIKNNHKINLDDCVRMSKNILVLQTSGCLSFNNPIDNKIRKIREDNNEC